MVFEFEEEIRLAVPCFKDDKALSGASNSLSDLVGSLNDSYVKSSDPDPSTVFYLYITLGDLPSKFTEFFRNSYDAIIKRGTEMEEQYEGEVVVSLTMDEQGIAARFSDNGAGIPASVLPILGQEYVHVKSLGSTFYGGRGLGIKDLTDWVNELRGSLEGNNNEDGGAAFDLWLPEKPNEPVQFELPVPDMLVTFKDYRDYFVADGLARLRKLYDQIGENPDSNDLRELRDDYIGGWLGKVENQDQVPYKMFLNQVGALERRYLELTESADRI